MLTRRQVTRRGALVLVSAGAALAVIRTSVAGVLHPVVHARATDSVPSEPIEFVPDRGLHVSLSDLALLSWTYAGQRYEERRDRVVGNEGECILLTIVNDTASAQRIDLDGSLFAGTQPVRLRVGQSVAIELMLADIGRHGVIRHEGRALPIEIRPSYQHHELHLSF